MVVIRADRENIAGKLDTRDTAPAGLWTGRAKLLRIASERL